jgi:predicted MFS family arabinose efflux permease
MNAPALDHEPPRHTVVLGLRQAAPNGEIARVLLAFLATAGIYYVNIMPALVDGLVQGAGFTNRQAGLVASSNIYGAALGALAAVFFVKRIAWKKVAYLLLASLITIDLLSMLLQHFLPLVVMRFGHGVIGGMLVGVGFSIIARTSHTDRTFGYLLLVQFGLGGLGMLVLPPLVPLYGTFVLFLALILFGLATLLMLPFLTAYPVTSVPPRPIQAGEGVRKGPLALSLLATFLFQAGNMGASAYLIGLAVRAGHSMSFISPTLAAASWLGLAGAGLVIFSSPARGRSFRLVTAILLTAAGTWALHFSASGPVYLVANCLVGMTWAFGIPCLLGMSAEFDRTGQMAALGGFASKMGMASGPLVAALVVGEDQYGRVLNVSTVLLVLSLLAAWVPMRLLDRHR